MSTHFLIIGSGVDRSALRAALLASGIAGGVVILDEHQAAAKKACFALTRDIIPAMEPEGAKYADLRPTRSEPFYRGLRKYRKH